MKPTQAAIVEAIAGFGMDTITLAGPLEAKLAAMKAAGFSQVILKASGLRGTGFQVLRDFEGLSGHLHSYKIDIAKAMLEMCAALDCKVLLACSSTSAHATQDLDHIARDLRKLAMLALPLGIRIAYEGLSWGRTVNEFTSSWDVVCRADCPNLGIGLDSFHIFAAKTALDEIDYLDPSKIFLVQLSDFMWQETKTFEERMATARTFRVFPGEGVHSEQIVDLVQRLDKLGYAGDYSFEVFNDDYQRRAAPLGAAAQPDAVEVAGLITRLSARMRGRARVHGTLWQPPLSRKSGERGLNTLAG
jgi:sugar phosphate isomerase/epimerase